MTNCIESGILSKTKVKGFAAVVKDMEDNLKFLFWKGLVTGSILTSILVYSIKVLWK